VADGSHEINKEAAEKVLAQIDEQEIVEFLQGLVRVPSVNPPGDVREGISYCANKLAAEGFDIEYVTEEEEKPNLLASLSNGNGPTLLFNAHIDVVPTGDENNWSHPPFGAELVDGKVYGRGAGDDKASVTAQVMAAVALARSGVQINGKLIVNEVADEEVGGALGAQLCAKDPRVTPDYVIVGEQTLNRVCLGEKGGAGCNVTVYGRAAHGALPWEGVNAIDGMGKVIVALQNELQPKLAERTHPLFKPSSSTISLITGGVKANVVPDMCQIYVDRRTVPGETPEGVRQEIDEIAQKAIEGVAGLRVEVELGPMGGREAHHCDLEDPLPQAMLKANEFLGFNPEPTGFSMGTDGRHFVAEGYPAIVYGPGDPALAHQPDEWVGVDEVVDATKAYALAAVSLLASK
jgi:succinyl-diaminopimelate desuccinylase